MSLELRRCGGPVELREDGESPRIEGYGSVFYDADDPGTEYELWRGAVERVMPGSFDATIKEDDVRGLFNHDPNLILGRTKSGTLRLSVDSQGLQYSIDPPRTSVGDDLVETLRRGDISGSSIGFEVTEVNWRDEDEKEVREIHGFRLWDVGPVTFPAFESTTSGIRSLKDLREAERKLLESERARTRARAAYRRRHAEMACLGVDYLGRVIADPAGDYLWYSWDLPEARAWLKDNDFHVGKLDESDNHYRFRQVDPGQFDTFRNVWNGSKSKPTDFNSDEPKSRPVMFVRGKKASEWTTQAVSFYHGKADQAD